VGTVKPARNWAGILSLIFAIMSWFFYPYVMGILTLLSGVYSLYSTRKNAGKIAFIAIFAIIIAIASLVVDSSYIGLISPHNLPPIK